MILNEYSEVVLDEDDIIEELYSKNITSLNSINIENEKIIDQFNKSIEKNADPINLLRKYIKPTCSLEEFDKTNQSTWHIPDSYKNFDIASWLLEKCQTEEEQNRVIEELELFVQYNMIDILICLKYLVDFMRENKIVWGVGRGSSVASYCLYLIGIHKINSLKYSLDIKEFLKGESNG